MDIKKGNADISGNNEDDSVENFHFGKALAFRAVYGSSGFQRSGSRKTRGNDSKTSSPSRLSKVTYKVVVDDIDA